MGSTYLPCMDGCGVVLLSRRGNRPRRCEACWKAVWRRHSAKREDRDIPADQIEATFHAALKSIKARRVSQVSPVRVVA